MSNHSPILFVEINSKDYIFVIGNCDESKNFTLKRSIKIPMEGISENKISDLNLVSNIIKKNIYSLENEIDFVFEEVIIIVNNFECSLINLSGYKKLNGSQLSRDNITYMLNSLKSKITEVNNHKKILHIFNSNYLLDKKKINNLPIGLFGNFYSQELSFFLINDNDFKNLKTIFNKCNLRIKKVISKNFLEGVNIIESNLNIENFFKIEISEDVSEIIFFDDSSLKYMQKFRFGTDLILNDICKITSLNIETVREILSNLKSSDKTNESHVEKDFFKNQNFRKIKKKLLFEIAKARIQEFAEIMILKNINLKSFIKKKIILFLKVHDQLNLKCFKEDLYFAYSNNSEFEIRFIQDCPLEEFYLNVNKLVQFGWKKEAVPIINEKKSFITKIFNIVFK